MKGAAEKEALAIEGAGDADDQISHEAMFDEMEGKLLGAIEGAPYLNRQSLRDTGIPAGC